MSSTLLCRQLCTLPWQVATFCLALLIYATTGSPTPDDPGLGEAATAVLLLVSIRFPDFKTLPAAVLVFLLYGLSVPTLLGVVRGHHVSLILRDVIAFGFLLMPLLYVRTHASHASLLASMLVLTGCVFSVRAVLPYGDAIFSPAKWLGQAPADLLYLANSPEVLFAALMLLGSGAYRIWAGQGMLAGLLLIGMAALPLLAMAVMMQRAGLGCVALVICLLGTTGLWLRPARALLGAGCVVLMFLPFLPLVSGISHALLQKTEMVGLNSRAQELAAVWSLSSQSPLAFLTGLGWGASFENPAVGNIEVNYTHSLFSALLLKSGVMGVLFFLGYLWMITKQAAPELLRRPVLVLALAAPLGIGLFFYASYKSLGFGMVLLLLSLLPAYRKLEKNQVDMP